MFTKKERKVVVVTGASAGIGRAAALLFGRKKYSVGLIARNKDRLESLQKEIESKGGKAVCAFCDVADPDQVEEAARVIESALGPIDIWVNNAMVSILSLVRDMSPDEFKRVTDVTYLGYVYGTLCALKRMESRGKGIIIQVGSVLAYRGIPLQSAYCAAKHAIKGFTESLRCELLHENSPIKITMVQMPAVNTPQFNWVKNRLERKPQPVPPIYQPEIAARAIYWASLNYRRELYISFSAALAIVCNKFFPGFLDKHLAKTGFESQQYDGLDDPNRKDNLFETVDGPFGAHGDFDSRARKFSFHFWVKRHWKGLFFACFCAVLVILGLVLHFQEY